MAKTRMRSGRKRRGGEGTSQRLKQQNEQNKEREAKLNKMRATRKQGKNDEAAEVHKALASLDRRLSAEEKGTAAVEETFGFPKKASSGRKASSVRKASSSTVYGFPSETKKQKRTGRLTRLANFFRRNKKTNKKTVKRNSSNSSNNPFSSVRRTNPMYNPSPTNSAKQASEERRRLADAKKAEFGEMIHGPNPGFINPPPSPTGKQYTAAEAAAAAGMWYGPYGGKNRKSKKSQ